MQASTTTTCPVCLGSNGIQCAEFATPRDSTGFECQACGRFEISRSALVTYFDSRRRTLSALQRAALSHRLSTANRGSGGGIMITTDWMERFQRNARLPRRRHFRPPRGNKPTPGGISGGISTP